MSKSVCPEASRGAAMLEMVVIMPMFVLFVFSAIEFSRYIVMRAQFNDAIRQSARVLSTISASDLSECENIVAEAFDTALTSSNLHKTSFSIEPVSTVLSDASFFRLSGESSACTYCWMWGKRGVRADVVVNLEDISACQG